MKKSLLSLGLFVFGLSNLFAQNGDSLDANQLRASFQPSGFLSYNPPFAANFRLKDPVDSIYKSVIFGDGMWLSATDSSGNKRSAVASLNDADFGYGPWGTDTTRYSDTSFMRRYNRVWKLTAGEIQAHLNLVGVGGYIPPASILDWPAHGDTSKGEPLYLAPFVDVNGNKWYEPSLGDYPLIRGDEAVYLIFNDARHSPLSRTRTSMGIEVHLMAYAFSAPLDTPLHQTVFMNYRLFNRGNERFADLRAGIWTDFDLGFSLDDLVGSDSAESYGFCYNGGQDPGPMGFGSNPPSIAVVSLGSRFSGASYYINSGFGPMTAPTNDNEYDHLLNNRWRNGNAIIRENPGGCGNSTNGNGYSPGVNTPQTSWAFNVNDNWYQSPVDAGDMRLVMTYAPAVFDPGVVLNYDFAYVVSTMDSSSNTGPCSVFEKLDSTVVSVQSFFDVSQFPCLGCNISLKETKHLDFELYPNPVLDRFHIESSKLIREIELFDLSGRSIYQKGGNGETTLEVVLEDNLSPGIYLLKVVAEDGLTSTHRISKL